MDTRLDDEAGFISTGHLPSPEQVQKLVKDAYERFKSNEDGENSQVYPALARVPRDLFGVCVVGTSGNVYAAGDTDHEFSIMSVSKPFVFALICREHWPRGGAREARRQRHRLRVQLGRAASSGRPTAAPTRWSMPARSRPQASCRAPTVEREMDVHSRRAVASSPDARCRMNDEVLQIRASETNFRNRSIAQFLLSVNRIYCEPMEAVDLYTRQCSLNVSARTLR